MPAVRIVTDSTAYVPPALLKTLGIEIVSMYWDLGDGPVRESASDGNFGAFYEQLEASEGVATTAPPTVDDFVAVYQPLLAQGVSVVSIHVSSGMSLTCETARRAAARLAEEGKGGERIAVVDSAGLGGGQGLQVLVAARAAASSTDAERVLQRVREARKEVRFWFLLDTLEYLRRGGRIGTAAAWIGTTLKVKPILSVESEITAVERVRTRERGIERLIEFARRRASSGANAWVVQHARSGDDARVLVDRLREVFWRPPEFVNELGPVLGTHGGPGAIGFASLPSRFLD